MELVCELPVKYVNCICKNKGVTLAGEWKDDVNRVNPLLLVELNKTDEFLRLRFSKLNVEALRKLNQAKNRVDIYMYLEEAVSLREQIFESCNELLENIPQSQDYRSIPDPRDVHISKYDEPPIRIVEGKKGGRVKVNSITIGYGQFCLTTNNNPFIVFDPEMGKNTDPSPRLHIATFSELNLVESGNFPPEIIIDIPFAEIAQLLVSIDGVFDAFKRP